MQPHDPRAGQELPHDFPGQRPPRRPAETREGEKRTVVELEVDEVGPSLRYATAKVNKVSRGSGASRPGGAGGSTPANRAYDDPWDSVAAAGGDAPVGDEPPF